MTDPTPYRALAALLMLPENTTFDDVFKRINRWKDGHDKWEARGDSEELRSQRVTIANCLGVSLNEPFVRVVERLEKLVDQRNLLTDVLGTGLWAAEAHRLKAHESNTKPLIENLQRDLNNAIDQRDEARADLEHARNESAKHLKMTETLIRILDRGQK